MRQLDLATESPLTLPDFSRLESELEKAPLVLSHHSTMLLSLEYRSRVQGTSFLQTNLMVHLQLVPIIEDQASLALNLNMWQVLCEVDLVCMQTYIRLHILGCNSQKQFHSFLFYSASNAHLRKIIQDQCHGYSIPLNSICVYSINHLTVTVPPFLEPAIFAYMVLN